MMTEYTKGSPVQFTPDTMGWTVVATSEGGGVDRFTVAGWAVVVVSSAPSMTTEVELVVIVYSAEARGMPRLLTLTALRKENPRLRNLELVLGG